MEELWDGYQREFDFQHRLHTAHLSGPFKDKADKVLRALLKLQKAWEGLKEDGQEFFIQHYIDNPTLPFFVNNKSLVDTPYGPANSFQIAAKVFSENLASAIVDLESPRGIYFQGKKERIANKWLIKTLIDHWATHTGERPTKHESHPSILYVGAVLKKLCDEYVAKNETLAAKELRELYKGEDGNYAVTCGQIVDKYYPSKNQN